MTNPVVRISTAPPARKVVNPKHDWPGIRQALEANPDMWLELEGEFSKGMYSYVRQGKVTSFFGMGGTLDAKLVNQRPRDGSSRTMVGELWLHWTPPRGWKPPTEEDNA